jgi:hypothetical protein
LKFNHEFDIVLEFEIEKKREKKKKKEKDICKPNLGLIPQFWPTPPFSPSRIVRAVILGPGTSPLLSLARASGAGLGPSLDSPIEQLDLFSSLWLAGGPVRSGPSSSPN